MTSKEKRAETIRKKKQGWAKIEAEQFRIATLTDAELCKEICDMGVGAAGCIVDHHGDTKPFIKDTESCTWLAVAWIDTVWKVANRPEPTHPLLIEFRNRGIASLVVVITKSGEKLCAMHHEFDFGVLHNRHTVKHCDRAVQKVMDEAAD